MGDKMKLSRLIKRLQELKLQLKSDPDIVIDYEGEDGWFDLEKVQVVDCEAEIMINLQSSNES
jgi:hypothetical protein